MDPKTAYWTWAWLNMALAVGTGLAGVRRIRRGEIQQHKRRMLFFVGLIVLFLLSYVLKLIVLGRENLELWKLSFVYMLRFHELCVLTMVVSASIAVRLAYALGLARGVPPAEVDPVRLRRHRRAGATALAGGVVGLLSAAYVLFGMYAR